MGTSNRSKAFHDVAWRNLKDAGFPDRILWHKAVAVKMDHNVDPSSTMQVVNQLVKHNKEFDLLVLPGMDHGFGGPYGEHKRFDFFVRNLLGITPPAWTDLDSRPQTGRSEDRQ